MIEIGHQSLVNYSKIRSPRLPHRGLLWFIRGLAFISILSGGLLVPACAQIVGDMEDESRLYAESKQVNQFFRRFNGEEDEKGNRYYPGDKQHRSDKLRRQYLRVLFDESNSGISS